MPSPLKSPVPAIAQVPATFATNDLTLPIDKSKGNLAGFKKSRFIIRQTDAEVDFATPMAPAGLLLKSVGTGIGEYAHRKGYEWIGKNIPRADAKELPSLKTLDDVQHFADRMGIAPGVVVGRLQHDSLWPYSKGNQLKLQLSFPYPWSRSSGR